MDTTPFELSSEARTALTDALIRTISQVPQLVGTDLNWMERAATSIITIFEAKGIAGLSGISVMRISRVIEELTTPVSKGPAAVAAELVFAELAKFTERAKQQASAAGIPTDETHEFGLTYKDSYQAGLRGNASGVLTHAEALAVMGSYEASYGIQRMVLLARPKQTWTAITPTE